MVVRLSSHMHAWAMCHMLHGGPYCIFVLHEDQSHNAAYLPVEGAALIVLFF